MKTIINPKGWSQRKPKREVPAIVKQGNESRVRLDGLSASCIAYTQLFARHHSGLPEVAQSAVIRAALLYYAKSLAEMEDPKEVRWQLIGAARGSSVTIDPDALAATPSDAAFPSLSDAVDAAREARKTATPEQNEGMSKPLYEDPYDEYEGAA